MPSPTDSDDSSGSHKNIKNSLTFNFKTETYFFSPNLLTLKAFFFFCTVGPT